MGEDVEIGFGAAPGVRGRISDAEKRRTLYTVTNDRPAAIFYEAEFAVEGQAAQGRCPARQARRATTMGGDLPANGRRTLTVRYANG